MELLKVLRGLFFVCTGVCATICWIYYVTYTVYQMVL